MQEERRIEFHVPHMRDGILSVSGYEGETLLASLLQITLFSFSSQLYVGVFRGERRRLSTSPQKLSKCERKVW
jgi:hypothetical protein